MLTNCIQIEKSLSQLEKNYDHPISQSSKKIKWNDGERKTQSDPICSFIFQWLYKQLTYPKEKWAKKYLYQLVNHALDIGRFG